MARDPIVVTTAADAAYVPHVAAMLHSLFESSPGETFSIRFLHRPGIEPALLQRLAELCRAHGATFADAAVDSSLLTGLPVGGWYVEEAWYRVFLPQVLADVRRVLWLDADTIVLQPIRELWETPLGGTPLAACPNAILYSAAADIARLGITDRSRYFNTGVLVLDLERMRAEDSEKTLRAAALANSRWIHFADQDVLNCVYHERYTRLALAWNVLTHSYINVPETVRVHGHAEYRDAMRSPRILHFTGRTAKKPWSYRCGHPYRDAYLRHRRLAGWPPPDYADRSFGAALVRYLPLRLREILSALRKRRLAESLSYLRRW